MKPACLLTITVIVLIGCDRNQDLPATTEASPGSELDQLLLQTIGTDDHLTEELLTYHLHIVKPDDSVAYTMIIKDPSSDVDYTILMKETESEVKYNILPRDPDTSEPGLLEQFEALQAPKN